MLRVDLRGKHWDKEIGEVRARQLIEAQRLDARLDGGAQSDG